MILNPGQPIEPFLLLDVHLCCCIAAMVLQFSSCNRMPPRKPPIPPLTPIAEARPGHQVTDTMSLVIYDSAGEVQFRVRDGVVNPSRVGDAVAPPVVTTPATPAPATSVLNRIRFDDLRVVEELGKGSQGKVRKVQHKETREVFALKTLTLSTEAGNADATRQMLQHELVRIAAVQHQNVVTSHEAYFRENKLFILMELMDAGTVAQVLKLRGRGFPATRLAFVTRDFFTGLAHLHQSDVIHRDIKPGNLLANSKGEVKISDFGVAGTGGQRLHETGVGSAPYMSPERLNNQPYSMLCDVWSAGLTVAELCIGSYPFGDCKGNLFQLCMMFQDYTAAPKWDLATGEATDLLKDFVRQCMRRVDGPEPRPNAATLLNHPFLASALPTRE